MPGALSPAATEIEAQTVRWIAELIGYPIDAGGLLVSGGNVGNLVCLLAARAAKVAQVREHGVGAGRPLRVYASTETHTWIQKAADICGIGTPAVRWIPIDGTLRMDVAALRRQIEADTASGELDDRARRTAGRCRNEDGGAGVTTRGRGPAGTHELHNLPPRLSSSYGRLVRS